MSRVGLTIKIRGRPVSPLFVVSVVSAVVATVAIVDRALISALALNIRWDAFYYHLPFAAIWGGLSIPYDMNDAVRPLFDGYPPLPEMVQGLLWRLTGSVNATGVANFLAFGLFLIYCHKVLRAPFWLVALISLTAPMVLIHTAVSYVDLFGNSFLAIGVCSCLALYLFPERRWRTVVVCGLAGLAIAAWSKYLLVPVIGVMFILFAIVVLRSKAADRFNRRQVAVVFLVFATLAAAPYVKNLAVYGNPLWPTKVPLVGSLFPYIDDAAYFATQRPADLLDAPQAEVFFQSLFEINVPTSYPNRLRWIVDQGSTPTQAGFRMGGFWGVGVVVYLLITFGMLVAFRRRAGVIVSIAAFGVLCVISVIPASNNMRYYLFIPLTWAATIGMLYPELRDRFPRAALGLLGLVLVLFGYMVSENSAYYPISRSATGMPQSPGTPRNGGPSSAGKDLLRRGHEPDRDDDDGTHDARVLDRGPHQGLALSGRHHRRDGRRDPGAISAIAMGERGPGSSSRPMRRPDRTRSILLTLAAFALAIAGMGAVGVGSHVRAADARQDHGQRL